MIVFLIDSYYNIIIVIVNIQSQRFSENYSVRSGRNRLDYNTYG